MKTDSSFLQVRALSIRFLLFASVITSSAHEDLHTHPALSVGAMLFLDQVNPEDGALISQTARNNVRQGSIDEDACPNYLNHFYNPTNGENTNPRVSPLCPLQPIAYQTAPGRAAIFWDEAVLAYRQGSSAAFTKLGWVFHLLQDMTSPAHVHNDLHAQIGAGGTGCHDGDDFENWGWSPLCTDFGPFNHIYDYIQDDGGGQQLKSPTLVGLQTIFQNRPQLVSKRSIDPNIAYSFLHVLAGKVYEFSSFYAVLEDTASAQNDLGSGEFKTMFSSLEEDGTGWLVNNMGWSNGDCSGGNQAWWVMNDGNCDNDDNCGFFCKRVKGYVYIENTGGGDGEDYDIPNNLRPSRYNRTWFRQRYGSITNTGVGKTNRTMLQIYGDVLYPAAVAYGAGLVQAFLDAAIMPKPITDKPTQLTGISAQLIGRVRPAGEEASAWFEWGTNTSYGTPTQPLPVGAGQALTSFYTRVEGLSPDTIYYCRIVSSNRFGVRRGTNQIFRTPAMLITGNTPNAWQITDRTNNSFLNYSKILNTPSQQAAANGWRYTIKARMVDDFGGSKTMTFVYGMTASRRFLVWWDLDTSGNLTAEVEGRGTRVIATNELGATLYHTHEIFYTNGAAKYFFDGIEIDTWPGVDAGTTPGGQIVWGSGSSAGMGQMNFQDVEFEIAGSGVVASYRAGSSGVATNPALQGWTANPPSPVLPNAFTPISPDFEPYLPLVETLGASQVGLATARLNGRGDPRGESAKGWFEWGTSVAYGNATSARDLGDGFGWSNFSESLTGLAADQAYHSRFVVSNAFTVVFGGDQIFVTAQPVTIVAARVPQSGQIHLQCTGAVGAAYEVLRSSDLSIWTSIGQATETSGGMFEFLDTDAPTDTGFYQVRLVAP
jgi:hypothetical protein